MQDFPPRVMCKSFRFKGHAATEGMTFYGKLVLSDDGLLLIPKSKQDASAGGWVHLLGVVALIVLMFQRSVKKVTWPFDAVPYRDLEAGLAKVPKLGGCNPDQPVLLVHRDQIVGFSSSFWKGFSVVCRNRVVIVPIGARSRLTACFRELEYQEIR